MQFLIDLWLPIVLSAVAVFVISSLVHMLFGYHANDAVQLPNEEATLAAMRETGVVPGEYVFPRPASMKDMASDEMVAKMNAGPVGFMTVLPNGPWAMGKQLGQWFAYSLFVGILVAYLASITIGVDTSFDRVFRVCSTAAFLAYAGAEPTNSIWKARSWITTLKFLFDGLLYALATGALFGWLWPS